MLAPSRTVVSRRVAGRSASVPAMVSTSVQWVESRAARRVRRGGLKFGHAPLAEADAALGAQGGIKDRDGGDAHGPRLRTVVEVGDTQLGDSIAAIAHGHRDRQAEPFVCLVIAIFEFAAPVAEGRGAGLRDGQGGGSRGLGREWGEGEEEGDHGGEPFAVSSQSGPSVTSPRRAWGDMSELRLAGGPGFVVGDGGADEVLEGGFV